MWANLISSGCPRATHFAGRSPGNSRNKTIGGRLMRRADLAKSLVSRIARVVHRQVAIVIDQNQASSRSLGLMNLHNRSFYPSDLFSLMVSLLKGGLGDSEFVKQKN